MTEHDETRLAEIAGLTPEREAELRGYVASEEPASMQRDWFACTLRRDGRHAARDLLAALDTTRRELAEARADAEANGEAAHTAACRLGLVEMERDEARRELARLETECARLDAQLVNARVSRNEAQSETAAAVAAIATYVGTFTPDAINAAGDGFTEVAISRSVAAYAGLCTTLTSLSDAARARDEALRAEGREQAAKVCDEMSEKTTSKYRPRTLDDERATAALVLAAKRIRALRADKDGTR